MSEWIEKWIKDEYVGEYVTLGCPSGSVVWRIHLPMQETQVQSPGREDLLEREMATHSRILASEIPQERNWAGYSPWDHKRVRHDLATKQ